LKGASGSSGSWWPTDTICKIIYGRNTGLEKIDVINDKLNKARTAVCYERIDPADFLKLKAEREREIAALERQISELPRELTRTGYQLILRISRNEITTGQFPD